MIILIIQVEDFPFDLVDPERDPPIAGDAEAPAPLAVAGELMGFPTRDVTELVDGLQTSNSLSSCQIAVCREGIMCFRVPLKPPYS